MKKIVLTAMGFTAVVSAFADPIDPVKAKAIAQEYCKSGADAELVGAGVRTRERSRLLKAELRDVPTYYVYSRGKGEGYVFVSGDDCLPVVLGCADSGDFDADNLPPALKDMMDYWQKAVETAQAEGTNTARSASPMAKAAALAANGRVDIKPFTTSHWHQTGPYNNLAPTRDDNGAKSMTGCVATAISQILYYWRKDLPETLQATTPTYGMDGYSHASVTLSIPKGTPLNWGLMLDSYGSQPKEYHDAVATMVYAVGTAAHLEYSIEDGTATSGHIEDIPKAISTYFGMNGGNVIYRESYSQERWTQAIYDQLAMGRPVMYTGVHDTSGGHAVYVDGYRASDDMMHFNFGWGGQSDGYYTTNLENGMNGFKGYQSALVNAYPKKRNLEVSLIAPPKVYANINSSYIINIKNKSTLGFSGVYAFLSTSETKPSAIKNAKASETETLIPVGEDGSVRIDLKVSTARKWYVTFTDENLNVLAQDVLDVESAHPELNATALSVYGSADKEEHEGQQYAMVYNSKVLLNATVVNDSDQPFGGTAKLSVYASEDGGKTFELQSTASKSGVEIPAGSNGRIDFSVLSLEAGKLYCAEISNEWTSGTQKITVGTENSNKVYFTIGESSDITAELNDGVLKFTGKWDAAKYQSLVERTTNKTAIGYDLTEVTGVVNVPDCAYPSPNAIIYANEGASGRNVVVNGKCKNLELTADCDYLCKTDIVAEKASLYINQRPSAWYMLTVPFDCNVPKGMLAKQVTGHRTTSSGINDNAVVVDRMEAGKSYLVMTSSQGNQLIEADASAGSVKVVCAAAVNDDPAFKGTFQTINTVEEYAKVLRDKEADKQYFMMVSDVETMVSPFRGYFYDAAMKTASTDFRAFPKLTLDPLYQTFGQNIQKMYDVQEIYRQMVTADANRQMLDSIASAEALFTSQSVTATTAVKSRMTAFTDFCSEYKMMIGDVGRSQIDFTAMIVNPSFEASATLVKGWSMETTGDVKIKKNSDLNQKTLGGDGELFAQSATGGMLYQTVDGLPAGIYCLKAKVGADVADSVTVSANGKSVNVAGHPFGKHYLSEAVVDEVTVGRDGVLSISVKASGWYNADDFRLAYVGNIPDETVTIEDITNLINDYLTEGSTVSIDDITALIGKYLEQE